MTGFITLRLQGLKDLSEDLCGERATVNWLSLKNETSVLAYLESSTFKTKFPNGATVPELIGILAPQQNQVASIEPVLMHFLTHLVEERQVIVTPDTKRYKAFVRTNSSRVKPSCQITGALATHCQSFYRQVVNILDSRTTCIDSIYTSLKSIMDEMSASVAESAKKAPSAGGEYQGNTLSLNILARAFDEFVEEIVKTKLTIATLGSAVDPMPNKGITFDDVAGLVYEKNQIFDGFIRPFRYPLLFPNRKRGMVLYGPAGTGKTTIIAAMQNHVQRCIFFSPPPGSLRSKYVGESARNIHGLFNSVSMFLDKRSNEYETAIIFIDEIDELAKTRSSNGEGGGGDDTVFTLLQMMDGVYADKRISVVGATNLLESIDPAILRRLELKVFIGLPTRKAREFAIRSKLKMLFSLPNVCDNDRIYRVTDPVSTQQNPAPYMYNIQQYGYGGRDANIPKPGPGQQYSPVREVDFLTDEDIQKIVDMTGPVVEAAGEYKERLEATEFVTVPNTIIPKGVQSRYGWSIADINSYIDDVVNYSRNRTITTGAVLDRVPLNKAVCERDKSVKPEYMYAYNPDYVNTDGTLTERWFRDPEIASKIVSFDLTFSDFRLVMPRFKPSTSQTGYAEFLKSL